MEAYFITPEIEHKKDRQRKLQRLYDNSIGAKFDNLDPNAVQEADADMVLFKLEKSLEKKKRAWKNNITLTTNYFKSICNLYSTFAIGFGVKMEFPDGEEGAADFIEFWEEQNMDSIFENNHKLSLATGNEGIMLLKAGDTIRPRTFGWNEYYPEGSPLFGYKNDEANLMWTLEDVFVRGDEYHYVVYVRRQENKRWSIQHKAYKSAPSRMTGLDRFEFGDEAPEVLEKIGITGLDESGFEPEMYDAQPFSVIQSPELDAMLLGESILVDILPQIQALYFFHTLIMLESEANMLSKLAIPMSMIPQDEEGEFAIGNTEFIGFDDKGQIPQFIVKNVDYDYIFKEIEKILEQISLQTGIPVELLTSEGKGGNEKVDLAKIRQKPFEKSIKSQQKNLKKHFMKIYKHYYDLLGQEAPRVIVTFEEVFDRPEAEVIEEALNELEKGAISLDYYYKKTRPEWSDSERDEAAESAREYIKEKSDNRIEEAKELEKHRAENRFESAEGRQGQRTDDPAA